MRLRRSIPPIGTRTLALGLWSAGVFLAGCTPEEVQAPPAEIEAAVAPTSGLIGEWKLDQTSGTTAIDTKNGYNATVFGGAAFVAGKLGNALNLNNGTAGTGGKYAQMPSNATLDNVQEGNYTISAWFFPYTVPTDATVDNRHWAIVVKASPHMGLMYNAAGKFLVRHYLTGAVGEQAAGATVYPAGAWYHVASTVSKTAGTVKVYVNGAFQDQASFAANTVAEEYGTTPFQVGRSGTFWAADGKVDQVRIYNRELSATEIADLYSETTTSAGPTVTTNTANGIRQTTATLRGSANPNGASTTAWFRYSTTNPGSCNDSFGTRSPSSGGTALGSGTAAVAYSRSISELTGGRLYYFCAIAGNSGGTSFGTVRSFRAGGVGLRFGPGSLGLDSAGMGPGDDMVGPGYPFILESTPELNKIHEHIALADQHDVVVAIAPSRSGGGWAPGGNFDMALYRSKVEEFAGDTMFRRAVNQRRVVLYVVDEPQHPKYNGTISPNEVNQMGQIHKEIWPGSLTFVRMSGTTLANGWDDALGNHQPPPAGGYTYLDYGWVQYSAQHTASTFAQLYAQEKQTLASLNMGMVPGINWWAAGTGHRGETSLDGVTSCWRIDYPATRLGYIVGIDQAAPYSEGAKYDCGTLPTGVTRTVASPDWIKRWADVVSADADAPFVAIWRHPNDDATIPGAEVLGKRPDFVSALDYAITQTASRTAWNGYRNPK